MHAAMSVRAPVGVACGHGGVRTRPLDQGLTARARCPSVQHRRAGRATPRVAQRRPLAVASEAGVTTSNSGDVNTRVAQAAVRALVELGSPYPPDAGCLRAIAEWPQPPALVQRTRACGNLLTTY